jgi:acyl-CoA reductase-like NAD-dependent aldehyde dehydrogenase
MIKPGTDWGTLVNRMRQITPEAFGSDGNPLNLIEGQWGEPGYGRIFLTPVDGSPLGRFPMIDLPTAERAVRYAANEAKDWSAKPLAFRKEVIQEALKLLRQNDELIALLLVWEIGKPWHLAFADVDRCIAGVEWYVQEIDRMVDGRTALGLISNIASWNYPLSVIVHAMLVQALAGNAVIAKTPSDGGLFALTLACALCRRAGAPFSLVSGSGGQLSEALVRHERIDCMAFVGGRATGRDVATNLYDRNKRYMLEMEGVNAWGVWEFSDWNTLGAAIKKGFEYGKQRCTAYPRYVVQRKLFPRFLEMYLPILGSLKWGHPLLVKNPEDPLPQLDFGPVINASKVEELAVMKAEALTGGAIPIFEGRPAPDAFLPGMDISAYAAPSAVLMPPRSSRLYHNEPFGPLDSVVIVDREEELIAEMNVSNGNLVSSIAIDDKRHGTAIAGELRAFKVGVNKVRSRGDRDEVFGGLGQSWKGCFVGGKYLVEAVTHAPVQDRPYGNFPDYVLMPEVR